MFYNSTDPFARKEWYDLKAPAMFTNRNVGKTPVNRTQGQSTCFYNYVVFVTRS